MLTLIRRGCSKIKIPATFRNVGTNPGKNVNLSMGTDGIAIMELNRSPVNALNLSTLQEIVKCLNTIETFEECKGLVITSGTPKVFSAGLDLTELYQADTDKLRMFAVTIQDIFLKLYGTKLVSSIAIHGYTAAGGFILATMCDHRVMVNNGSKMGINDSIVGIAPAQWICDLLASIMGFRRAEMAIIKSTMYTAEEALKIDLIDALATDKEDAILKCKDLIKEYDSIPIKVRKNIKNTTRRKLLDYVKENREQITEDGIKNMLDPTTQNQIGYYYRMLKEKKSS